MNSTFICVGVSPCFDITLVLDALEPDHVSRVSDELREAAGVAVNVARELKRLGKRSVLWHLVQSRKMYAASSLLKVFVPFEVFPEKNLFTLPLIRRYASFSRRRFAMFLDIIRYISYMNINVMITLNTTETIAFAVSSVINAVAMNDNKIRMTFNQVKKL